jgi:hypothetical protein
MNTKRLFANAALTFALLTISAAQAEPVTGQRWVSADNVRVRSITGRVIDTLWRGDEVFIKDPVEVDGFYLVEIERPGIDTQVSPPKQHGFVASRYLSAARIAGEDGANVPRRWVRASSVRVYEKPSPEAAVVSQMAPNTIVKQLRVERIDHGSYCEIQLPSGQNGFIECHYLAPAPVIDDYEMNYEATGDDIERAFWLEPSWRVLEEYAMHLKKLHPEIPPEGPWPRNDALERMKAHLALGLMGRTPEPYTDWSSMKRKLQRWQAQFKDDSYLNGWWMYIAAYELGYVIPQVNEKNYIVHRDENYIVHLVGALEFASVQPSLFRSEAEIAPPRTSAEEASGRFDITFRQIVTPRSKPNPENEYGAGLYDMLAHTQLLARPVKRVQLFRDGRLAVESSFLRAREVLWRDVETPMCWGHVSGFSVGDADPRIWSYVEETLNEDRKLNRNPPGSLFVFYTTIDLPRATALHTETTVRLDRDATGFVRGTYLYYDLNDDGIPDLAVWEGEGKGPENIFGQPTTDDRWYRLALVNINGAWKVLGWDVFSYGCGC